MYEQFYCKNLLQNYLSKNILGVLTEYVLYNSASSEDNINLHIRYAITVSKSCQPLRSAIYYQVQSALPNKNTIVCNQH